MCIRMKSMLPGQWWCCSHVRPKVRLLKRLSLSGASALPAESACCCKRTAAFASLVSAGETLEGTRGKLRCLVLLAQASSEYIPIQLRTGFGWCHGCTLLRLRMPLGVQSGKERPERVATWLILPVVICLFIMKQLASNSGSEKLVAH